MNSDRIREIQQQTAYPESRSVAGALEQVWNECAHEAGKLIAEIDAEYNSRTNHLIERHAAQIEYLQQRISELTQCDPSWYDASPADAFMLLKKAQERVKRIEGALNCFTDWHASPDDTEITKLAIDNARNTAKAALKEGE